MQTTAEMLTIIYKRQLLDNLKQETGTLIDVCTRCVYPTLLEKTVI